MIAHLRGTVELRSDPYIVIDVNGVGYKVFATADVLSKASPSSSLKVFTYTHVKEDALELYGFSTQNELKVFELLLSVSGIGPKTAIGVFAVGSSSEIVSAIQNGNVDFFTSVPRLGKKNAQKLIIELKNKLGSTVELDLSEPGDTDSLDMLAALKSFGFTDSEARMALKNVELNGKSTEEKIKLALKYLGR
jgi:holliday junction DNA helicase RuvA